MYMILGQDLVISSRKVINIPLYKVNTTENNIKNKCIEHINKIQNRIRNKPRRILEDEERTSICARRSGLHSAHATLHTSVC